MAKNHKGTKIGIGAAALAAAAGAYYFYGSKHAAKHRKGMKSWMVKARSEAMEQMENLKDLTKENYQVVVNEIVAKYKKAKNISPAELAVLAQDLREAWGKISSHLNGPKKTVRKPAKSKGAARKKK